MSVAAIEPNKAMTKPMERSLPALYDAHYKSLVRMATIYVDNVETAEEVVQDAFVKLMSGRYTVDEGNEAAYLRSVVLNGARSQLRRRRVRREKKPDAQPNEVAAEVGGVASTQRSEILAAIRRLPRKQAEVVLLRFYLDLSEQEIADTLGIAPGSVKSHAHRALAKLRSNLEGQR